MKIVFIINEIKVKGQVPEKVYGCSYSVYPTPDLAVLYNAAVLKNNNHIIKLFMIRDLEEIDKLPKADFYIINSVILSYDSDMEIAKKIKKKLIFFGPYPTLFPEKYLIRENIFVLRGETEHIINKAIIEPEKCLGVSYKLKGKIVNNGYAGIIENLDEIPYPLREIDKKEYFNPKLSMRKFTNVLASRGCANKCYFCVPNSISWARELEWKKFRAGKPPVKIRSAENVIGELQLIKKQGFEEFSFIDDQFMVGKDRVIKIAQAIKRLGLTYGMLARADRLIDEETVEELAKSKCRYVDIGAESFDQSVLDDIRKGIKVDRIFQSIDLLAKHNIEPKINIMFGTSPKENKKIIEETVQKTLTLPTNHCMFSIATPFPGTDFRKVALENNWIMKDDGTNPASVAQIQYPHLSNKELEAIARKANFKFYFRFKVIKSMTRNLKSPSAIYLFIRSAFNHLKNFI